MFQEMAQYQSLELGNPKGFWDYTDEDIVGWVRKVNQEVVWALRPYSPS